MIDLEFTLWLDWQNPILGYAPNEPIPTDHTLDDVLHGIRQGLADYAQLTGADLGSVTVIRIAVKLREPHEEQAAEPHNDNLAPRMINGSHRLPYPAPSRRPRA